MTPLTIAPQKRLKRISLIKPATSRLFFLFIILFPVFSHQETTVSETDFMQFRSASLFFRKEISELTGALIGTVKGKIEVKGDSIEAYLVYKEDAKTVGYDGKHPYEIIGGKRITDNSSESVPPEIDVRGFVNPLLRLASSERKENNGEITVYPGKKEVDSAAFYYGEKGIDSVLFFRKETLLIKTIYSDYENGFPLTVLTMDYEKNLTERVSHYKVRIQR